MNTKRIKRMAVSRVLLCLFILTLPLKTYADETVTLTNGEWPPYLSKRLKGNGFVSHIVADAFKLKSINVNYVFRPWKRALEEAKNGSVNGSVIWSITKEREKDFLFSDPVIVGKSVLFHLKDTNVEWKQYSDLSQYKIGGTLGYEYSFELTRGVAIERVASDELNFKKLFWKRIDLFPSDKDAGYVILNKHFSPQQIANITYHPRPYDQTVYRLILSKKDAKSVRLLAQFNEGLKALRASGRYDSILAAQESGTYNELFVATEPHR